MESIRNMLTFQSSVIRNSTRVTLPVEEVVPGDVVLVESGDKIPADLRLFRVKNLFVDESMLTGESVPVEKSETVTAPDTVLAERTCLAFAGALVTSGQASGVVVATGSKTQIGRISQMVRDIEQIQTPLLLKLSQLGRQLTAAILIVAAFVFFFGVFVRHYSVKNMFLAAVGLSVAAIPEGLPAIITITLAIGVKRMARRNAIIRRLPAVETLGSVTVICSDKTGTLTRNEMTVTSVVLDSQVLSVTGTGYTPQGQIQQDGRAIPPRDLPLLQEIAKQVFYATTLRFSRRTNTGLSAATQPKAR